MPFRLGKIVNKWRVISRVRVLTHFLDEPIYDLEGLRRRRPSLILRQSV
jgi:hypothetical protein